MGHLLEKVEKMVANEGGYFNLEKAEKERKPLDENQNPAQDAREEEGARPKQNSGLDLPNDPKVETGLNE